MENIDTSPEAQQKRRLQLADALEFELPHDENFKWDFDIFGRDYETVVMGRTPTEGCAIAYAIHAGLIPNIWYQSENPIRDYDTIQKLYGSLMLFLPQTYNDWDTAARDYKPITPAMAAKALRDFGQ